MGASAEWLHDFEAVSETLILLSREIREPLNASSYLWIVAVWAGHVWEFRTAPSAHIINGTEHLLDDGLQLLLRHLVRIEVIDCVSFSLCHQWVHFYQWPIQHLYRTLTTCILIQLLVSRHFILSARCISAVSDALIRFLWTSLILRIWRIKWHQTIELIVVLSTDLSRIGHGCWL